MLSGGGFKSIAYSLSASNEVGHINMFKAILSKNTCKTCALGMGGQNGAMTDEEGNKFEICKKSFQAHITDIQNAIPDRFFDENSIDELKRKPALELERLGRLNKPIYKGESDDKYKVITWEESSEKIINKFNESNPNRTFFYSSGRSSNEAAFLLHLFARVYGTNNVNNCSFYCHQASGVGIGSTIGSGTATIQLKDLEKTDLIFVIGANPASNHPRFVRQLLNCRRRGGRVVVINPAKEAGLIKFSIPSDVKSMLLSDNEIASDYIQINIGGDIALMKGISKAILNMGCENKSFIEEHSNNYEEYVNDLNNTSWEEIIDSCRIERKEIEYIGKLYADSRNAVFSWAMGITHHLFGVGNVETIVNLAMLRGMIGKENSGLLPLRGHSNVQGIGSVGVTPKLKSKIFDRIEANFKIKLPVSEGLDTMGCMDAAYNKEIDLGFMLGGNLYASNPDSKYAEESLNRIPFKVYMNTTINQGHLIGTEGEVLILPVKTRDEEVQKTTQESMFNYVRLSDGGIERLSETKSEVEIISTVAEGVLGNEKINFLEFRKHSNIRIAIAKTIPGFEKIGQIDDDNEEFQIEGRTFHKPVFNTDDGRGNFSVVSVPNNCRSKGEYKDFRMMTVRSEGQYNSIVYENKDSYRGQSERWIVMMNRNDINRLGVGVDDFVDLHSDGGMMERVKVKEFDVKEGNIITYYPESNVLVSKELDKRSKTPSFKLTWVNIKRK